MNENTLKAKISEIEEKLNNSIDPVYNATLSDDLKKLKMQLSNLNIKPKKENIIKKTQIDVPIVGDRKEQRDPNRPGAIRQHGSNNFSIGLNI